MLKDIIEARALGGFRLYLQFEDGVAGELDLADIVRMDGVFAPLRDPKVFAAVRVDRELGTICWPTGADLDPDVLYSRLIGRPLPTRSAEEVPG